MTFKYHPETSTGIVLFVLLSVIAPLSGVILEITMAPDNSDGFLITDALPKTKDEKSQEALAILFYSNTPQLAAGMGMKTDLT
ncbi:MAG: hypothetical protein ABR985_20450 [Methanotrichaceae archaeon]|jgi:hypothetical protein